MRRFLTFCVEAALRGDTPKEYVVGTAVFDRKDGYDPRVDPIVRVEARRLREKLEEYYSTQGAADDVIICLPKGSYVPLIQRKGTPAEPRPVSIAVLPFTNLSRESSGDYFSDGLTEELIHRLTRVEGLRVLAWPSASRLRGRADDSNIRAQFQIDYVLRGSVRHGGSEVRITAQLVEAATSEIRWSERYGRALSGLFDLQDEIASAIVSTLRLQLGRPGKSTGSAASHDLCLKGRYLAASRTVDTIRQSIACYEQAIAADPTNAAAFTGLADGLCLLAEYAGVATVPVMERARENASRALELDPLLAEAHVSLAMIRSQYEWEWPAAEQLYRRAIELNPGYARARHWFAIDHLALLGRWEEAAAELETAIRLDPLSAIILEGRGHLALLQRDYPRALEGMRAVLEFEPGFRKAWAGIGRVYTQQGRYGEALDAFERASADGEGTPSLLGARGQVLGILGRHQEALECLRQLRERCPEKRVPHAIVLLGLGRTEEALDLFEIAAGRREPSIAGFGVHPLYDPLRSHPRFRAILSRAGFLP